MKKLKTLLIALVTLLTVTTSFSQTEHIFGVGGSQNFDVNTLTDSADVEIGDTIKIYNNTGTAGNFEILRNGVSETTSSSVWPGDLIYSYIVTLNDSINGDFTLRALIQGSPYYFVYIKIKFVEPMTTGIDEKVSDIELSVFPNPTTNFLNISSGDDKIETVKVFNMNGQLVFTDTFNSNDVKVDVSNLTNGFYMLFVNDNKPTRFVKN